MSLWMVQKCFYRDLELISLTPNFAFLVNQI